MNMCIEPNITSIATLGPAVIPNPFRAKRYYSDEECVIHQSHFANRQEIVDYASKAMAFEVAGPREKIYHDPLTSKAGIVTCGGLSPGLNNVIRALVMQLWFQYGIHDIFGFRYGYQGLNPVYWHEPIKLSPEIVNHIHHSGGTILGSSRGNQDIKIMVDTLEKFGVNLFFPIGGDGTMRGALEIANEIDRRKLNISVVGIPKTIDNDISYVSKTFGFETAFSMAVAAIATASAEAEGAYNGVGLVKLMGRHSGYVATSAALALKEVNFVLIPEVDFDLDGDNGFLSHLENRLKHRKHAVIVAAEGAGQKFFNANGLGEQDRDPSGNLRLGDIGLFLKERIEQYLASKNIDFSLKYIDPSYMIRSVPANASDAIFTGKLSQMAVHAALAGKTKMLVGKWNEQLTHVPIELTVSKRKVIEPNNSSLWQSVLDSTGQAANMINPTH